MFVETIFDNGCLVLSINDILDDPSWENFAWVVVDGATVALPSVPAVGSLKTIKRLIDASSILEKSLEIGVETYNTLKNFNSIWLERHHIFEKRFVDQFDDMSTGSMYSIAISKDIHQKITI